LSTQLRYREAADAFSLALAERPDDLDALCLRAGRYLSTLQSDKAYADFEKCLALGGEELDIKYRLGLCANYAGNYPRAMYILRRVCQYLTMRWVLPPSIGILSALTAAENPPLCCRHTILI